MSVDTTPQASYEQARVRGNGVPFRTRAGKRSGNIADRDAMAAGEITRAAEPDSHNHVQNDDRGPEVDKTRGKQISLEQSALTLYRAAVTDRTNVNLQVSPTQNR